MPLATPSRAAGAFHHARRLLRLAGGALIGGAALFCVLLLAVRYLVLPQLEAHREDLAALLSRQLGQPVEIAAIATGWDGWNPAITVRGLVVREGSGSAGVPLLALPEVRAVVSWTSIPLGTLRLRELEIDNPRLAIRRDGQGRIHVAGIEIDPDAQADDSRIADWLLSQRLIVVRDALLTWHDERRGAPQLVLDQVRFRLENRFGHHRFGLTGTPPPEIASPIDVRGDFTGHAGQDWSESEGQLFVRLDYADLGTWREWLPLPLDVSEGKGAVRLWFDFAHGVGTRVVADVELADVAARFASVSAPLAFSHVAGRLTWKQEDDQRELAGRSLALVPSGRPPLALTSFTLRYAVGADGNARAGDLECERLDLEPLAHLAGGIPFPQGVREKLDRFAPRGTLEKVRYTWKGAPDAPATFRLQADAIDVGFNAWERMPGLTGLSAAVTATETGGKVRLGSRDIHVALPHVFANPLALHQLTGDVSWDHSGDDWTVHLGNVAFATDVASGSASGEWRSRPQGPGEVDLVAKVARADIPRVDRYYPLALPAGLRDWLKAALRGGTLNDGQVTIKGDLAQFPFANGKGGRFLATGKVQEGVLAFAPGWPEISAIEADLRFEGAALAVTATRGRSLGAALGRTTAEIDDVARARLRVAGEASGPTAEFLAYLARSPLASGAGAAVADLQATGNGRLALRLDLALTEPGFPVKFSGDYLLAANQLRYPGAPTLSQVSGTVTFTEGEVRARDVAVEALGGAARLSLASANDVTTIAGAGNAKIAAIRNEFDLPLLERVSGTADWQFTLNLRPGAADWVLDSPMKGVALDLPAPFGKPAESAVPLRIERRALPAERDQLTADYGSIARAVVQRHMVRGDATVDRALVLLGRAIDRSSVPDRSGLTVRGDLAAVNADDWLFLADDVSRRDLAGRGEPLALAALDLQAGTFDVFGRAFHDMKLAATRGPRDWRLSLSAREVDGSATWQPPGSGLANGKVTAKLARLAMPEASQGKGWATEARPPGRKGEGSGNPWPELDVVADQYLGRHGSLGRLELEARPDGADWQIRRFSLAHPAGTLAGEGLWRARGADPQTKLDVTLDVQDTPAYLAAFGLPGAVKGAPTKIQGQLVWKGAPDDFDYPSLGGSLHVAVGAGQFTKIDPGIGKLLGVLSLQALPRRITLDFRDVFSEGFAFDSIVGDVRIASGVMRTDELLLNGPAARVAIGGEVNLERETQRLTVKVMPSLATSVSAGAGAAAILLAAANPLVGAAIGAGTLLAQKMMKDPIEQIFSYEYRVSGSWTDPVVERVARGRSESADAGTPVGTPAQGTR